MTCKKRARWSTVEPTKQKKLCGSILHKWVNQNPLNVASYESSWKSSHVRLLNVGNSSSRPSTSLDDRLLERRASSIPLGTGETSAVSGANPSRLFRRTSLHLEARMCANGWAAIRLLLARIGGGLLTDVLCRGGKAIKGGSHTTHASSRNRARRRVTSRSMGVSSPISTLG